MTTHDMINHPPHYTSHPSGAECIQFSHAMGFLLGNAFKYVWRHRLKNGDEDLRKAAWYIGEYLDGPKPPWADRLARAFAVVPPLCVLDPVRDKVLIDIYNGWKYDDRALLRKVRERLGVGHG